MGVEVSVLKGFGGRDVQLRKKWMKMWNEIASRILRLPPWMQNIVLDDINTAINNRIAIMEILSKTREARA